MEHLIDFVTQNFILICISIVLVINCIQYYKRQKRISLFSILIIAGALLLSIIQTLESVCKANANATATLVFAILGYTIRPVIIYLFILTSMKGKTTKVYLLLAIPLVLNLIVYLLAFIPAMRDHVVYFYHNDDGTLSFFGGELRFSSHIFGTLYLLFLIYISLSQLKAKHLSHAIAILACALFVVVSVVLETFFDSDNKLHLLNTTIGISALTYYLYSYIEQTQFDPLTGLFNRESYYHDLPRMGKSITGVIQFDLNGLKFINDNFGHLEGDKALATVAKLISSSISSNMYAYRLGGDEFIVLSNDSSEEDIVEVISKFKDALSKTTYHCSTGYSIRGENSDVSIEELIKEAETKMYLDKEEFYKTAEFDRRKR